MSSNEGGAPLGSEAVDDDSDSTVSANRALMDMLASGASFSGRERHCGFLNTRDGRFADVSYGSGFGLADVGRAIVLSDWDQDGDLDLWVTNRNGPMIRFLRNEAGAAHPSLSLRLRGSACNRDAIGARVEVKVQGQNAAPMRRSVQCGNGFLAQSTLELHFGLGSATAASEVVVHWPGGEAESFGALQAGRHLLVQGAGRARSLAARPALSLAAGGAAGRPSSDAGRIFLSSALPLPPLEIQGLDGAPGLVSEQAPGEALLVNLWGTHCAPCVGELREWQAARDELTAAGLHVLLLSTDGLASEGRGGRAAARSMLARLGVEFQAAMATPPLLDKLQVLHDELFSRDVRLALPTSLLIDGQGALVAIYRGPVHPEPVIEDAGLMDLDDIARRAASVPFPGRWLHSPYRRPFSPLVRALADAGFVEDVGDYVAAHRSRLQGERGAYRVLADLGNRTYFRGDLQAAAALYRQAIEERPGLAKAHFNLGVALEAAQDGAGAERAYQRAIDIREGYWQARFNLAGVLAARGERAAAARHLERVVADQPGFADGRYRLALLRRQDGDVDGARKGMEQTLAVDGTHRPAQLTLAWLLSTHPDPGQRDPERALTLARSALGAGPQADPVALDTLAAALAAAGHHDQAAATAREALAAARAADPEQAGDLAAGIRERLAAYEAGRVWVEQ